MDFRITAEKRILQCLREGIFATEASEDSNLKWIGLIIGPESSAFEGLILMLEIEFPSDYPKHQFIIKVLNPDDVFHPNFYTNGKICLDLI